MAKTLTITGGTNNDPVTLQDQQKTQILQHFFDNFSEPELIELERYAKTLKPNYNESTHLKPAMNQ